MLYFHWDSNSQPGRDMDATDNYTYDNTSGPVRNGCEVFASERVAIVQHGWYKHLIILAMATQFRRNLCTPVGRSTCFGDARTNTNLTPPSTVDLNGHITNDSVRQLPSRIVNILAAAAENV